MVNRLKKKQREKRKKTNVSPIAIEPV